MGLDASTGGEATSAGALASGSSPATHSPFSVHRGASLGQSRSAKQSVTQRFSAQRARAPHSLLYWHCTRAHAASSANATQSTTTPRSLMGCLYRAAAALRPRT